MSHQIAEAIEVEDVLDRLTCSLSGAWGDQFVAVALVEDDRLAFHKRAAPAGAAASPCAEAIALDGPGLPAWVARSGLAALVGDVLRDSRCVVPAGPCATRSELAVPLIAGGNVLGVIDLRGGQPRAFDCHDLELLTTIAEFTAAAIEKARLYAASRERGRELERLYQKERLLVEDMEHSYNELLFTLTELERRDELLRRSERLNALGELASGIAHDFNNLLAGILGNTQLLLMDDLDAERRRMLRVIEQAAQDGAAAVRRIQEFARKNEGYAFEDVGLLDVIDGALAITRPRWHNLAQREGREIQVRREITARPVVTGSPAELRELLINLIINAIDAMPSGGALTIGLSTDRERSQLGAAAVQADATLAVVEVRDTGVGVPAELRERIFDSFYSTKAPGRGSGLGLAMCRQIAVRHGGWIELASEVGQGSAFRVLLPVAEQPQLAAPEPVAAPQAAELRVLVADGDGSVRDVLARMLRRGGHQVTTAASCEEVLRQCDERDFDVLFTDLSLPGAGGASLVADLHARDSQLAVVIVTGWGHVEEIQPVPGARAVIAKPFDLAEVNRVIGEIPRRNTAATRP